MSRKRYSYLSAIISILLVFGLFNCEEVVTEDQETAMALVDSANTLLEPLFLQIFSVAPESLEGTLDLLNFDTGHGLFVEANNLDPQNDAASFGLAFTGLLILSQDQQFKELLEPYFSFYNSTGSNTAESQLIAYGFALPLSTDRISRMVNLFIELPLSTTRLVYEEIEEINQLHDHITNTLLPLAADGLEALEEVNDSTSVSVSGSDFEFTQADVHALQMSLSSLQGLFLAATAYDFELNSYDSVGVIEGFSQGGMFATLKENGSTNLTVALGLVNSALEHAVSALDIQGLDGSNHLLLPDPEENTSVKSSISDVISRLSEPNMGTYATRDMSAINPVSAEANVNISRFYNSPIADLKALLPPYTVEARSFDYFTFSDVIQFTETSVEIEGLEDTFFSIDFNYDATGLEPIIEMSVAIGYIGIVVDPDNPENLPLAFWDLYNEFQLLISDYTDDLYQFPQIGFEWSGYLTTGSSLTIEGSIEVNYQQEIDDLIVELTWTTPTYADWLLQWPDPSLNGIMPDQDSEELVYFMGYNEDNWNISGE